MSRLGAVATVANLSDEPWQSQEPTLIGHGEPIKLEVSRSGLKISGGIYIGIDGWLDLRANGHVIVCRDKEKVVMALGHGMNARKSAGIVEIRPAYHTPTQRRLIYAWARSGLSQKAAAETLGVPYSVFRRWVSPTVSTGAVGRLPDVFEVAIKKLEKVRKRWLEK